MHPGALRAPLSSLNALSCDHEEQILQLIREIGQILGFQPHHADSYLSNVRTLVRRSQEAARVRLESQKAVTPTVVDKALDQEGAIALSRVAVVIAADDLKWKKELPKWTVIVQGKTFP